MCSVDTHTGDGVATTSIPAKVAIFIIRAYQVTLSPHLPGICRFYPSCSHYGVQAFTRYGFAKGLSLTVRRLLKCRPGGPHGYDPVP